MNTTGLGTQQTQRDARGSGSGGDLSLSALVLAPLGSVAVREHWGVGYGGEFLKELLDILGAEHRLAVTSRARALVIYVVVVELAGVGSLKPVDNAEVAAIVAVSVAVSVVTLPLTMVVGVLVVVVMGFSEKIVVVTVVVTVVGGVTVAALLHGGFVIRSRIRVGFGRGRGGKCGFGVVSGGCVDGDTGTRAHILGERGRGEGNTIL